MLLRPLLLAALPAAWACDIGAELEAVAASCCGANYVRAARVSCCLSRLRSPAAGSRLRAPRLAPLPALPPAAL